MDNPTVEGNYTTIFKDGSIILENPWLILPDGHGKWYWNEELRGGVIHWFKPEEPYEVHYWYKLPDWELIDLVKANLKYEALANYLGIEKCSSIYNEYINTEHKTISELVKEELKNYEEYKKNNY